MVCPACVFKGLTYEIALSISATLATQPCCSEDHNAIVLRHKFLIIIVICFDYILEHVFDDQSLVL